MADYWYKLGQGSVILRLLLRNTASSVAAGKTGVLRTDADLRISYIVDNSATSVNYTGNSTIEDIATIGTYAAPSSNNCRFKAVDETNHPGLYEIQLANAAFGTAGCKSVAITVRHVNATPIFFARTIIVPLHAVDPYVAPTDIDGSVVAANVEASAYRIIDIERMLGAFGSSGTSYRTATVAGGVYTITAGGNLSSEHVGRWCVIVNAFGTVSHVRRIATVGSPGATNFTVTPTSSLTGTLTVYPLNAMTLAEATSAVDASTAATDVGTLLTRIPAALTFEDIGGVQMPEVSVRGYGGYMATASGDGFPYVSLIEIEPDADTAYFGQLRIDAATAAGHNNPLTAEQTAAAVDASTAAANIATLLSRITATLFNGITSLAQWLGAMAGKQTPNSTAQTEIRATGAGSGTFTATTDSLEAMRDRGDEAWTSASLTQEQIDAIAAGVAAAVSLSLGNQIGSGPKS